jgi:hypothetical protein
VVQQPDHGVGVAYVGGQEAHQHGSGERLQTGRIDLFSAIAQIWSCFTRET